MPVTVQVCGVSWPLRRYLCLNRCAIDEFKRSSDSWRSHAKTTAALRSEFAELLGDAEEPAQPAQDAQPGLGKQQDASAAASLHLLSGQPETAEAPKPKKVKKKASTQSLQHDIAEKPDKEDKSVAPGVAAGKPKKRLKGANVPAKGSAPAAAEKPAQRASSAVELERDAEHAPLQPGAVVKGADSKPKKRKVKGLAGSAAEGSIPGAANDRIGKKKKKQKICL